MSVRMGDQTQKTTCEITFSGEESSALEPKVLNAFDLLSTIGCGAFARVVLARRKDNSKLYALKIMSKNTGNRTRSLNAFRNESNILFSVSHPGIVKLDYTLESDRAYTLALEYCPGGDLFNLIQNKGKLNEEEARFYSGQIVNVIAHLHSKGIIYRDLKPENLLIDRNGNMKLADFGLAIQTRVDQREQRYGQVGTTEFFAPEIAANREYGTSVDWWSFGCVLYQMLTGAFPFFGENKYKLIDNILKKEPEYPAEFSAELVDLFKQLFEKDPTKRISTAGLKQHSWFAGLDWSALDNQTLQAPCIPNLTCDSDVENFDKEFTSLPIEDPFVVSGQISPLSVATRRDEDPNATFKSVSMILPPPVEIIQC